MHVSPAKHSYGMRDYQESVTTGQTDRRTDRRRTKWSLCAAMLRRRHNKLSFQYKYNNHENRLVYVPFYYTVLLHFYILIIKDHAKRSKPSYPWLWPLASDLKHRSCVPSLVKLQSTFALFNVIMFTSYDWLTNACTHTIAAILYPLRNTITLCMYDKRLPKKISYLNTRNNFTIQTS